MWCNMTWGGRREMRGDGWVDVVSMSNEYRELKSGMSRQVNLHDKRNTHYRKDKRLQVQKSMSPLPENKTKHVTHSLKPPRNAPPNHKHKLTQTASGVRYYLCKCSLSTSPYESWIVSSYLRQEQQSSCPLPSCLLAPSQQEPFRQ